MKKGKLNPMLLGAVLLGALSLGLIYYLFDTQTKQSAAELDRRLAELRSELEKKTGEKVVVQEKMEMRPVVYATAPIGANQKIDRVLVEVKQTPADLMPDAYTSIDEVADKYAARNINANEPLSPGNVTAERFTMSDRLTPGMRAIALPIVAKSDRTGGFAVDGDYVDILMTFVDPPGSKRVRTITVLQNIKVLYVPGNAPRTDQTQGLQPQAPPGAGDVVMTTFEVTPVQAELLTQLSLISEGGATQFAMFSIVLRNKDDSYVAKTKGIYSSDFFDQPSMIMRLSEKSRAQAEAVHQQLLEEKSRAEQDQNQNQNQNPGAAPQANPQPGNTNVQP